MEEKKSEITALDSFKYFLYSLIMPIIFSAIYTFLVVFLSAIFRVDYEVFSEHWLVKGLSYILSSLSFLCAFLIFYKRQNARFDNIIDCKTNYNVYSFLIIIVLSTILVFGFTNFIGMLDHVYALMGYTPSGDLPLPLNNVLNMFLSIIFFGLFPAICEELLFRGVIFKGLLSKYKPIVAILIGGTLFMLMHGSLQQTVYQLVLGFVLCGVYYYSKNIIYPMLLHFLNNALVIVLGYFETVSSFNINVAFTSAWNYIWPILAMIVSVLAVYGLLILLKSVNKNKYEHVVQTESEVMEKQVNSITNKWMIASILVAILFWVANTIVEWVGLI